MRIGFSVRACVLSAAAGLVYLPTIEVEAQSRPAYTSQRAPVTSSSGTASKQTAAAERSAVQKQLDAIYARFGRKPAPASNQISTENIAKADQKAAGKADKKGGKPRRFIGPKEMPIRQVSAERVAPASKEAASSTKPDAEPRRLIERPATRNAIESSRPARRLLPSIFAKKKTEPAQKQPKPVAAKGKTPIQQRLAELYKRDGREMPPMDLNQLPGVELKQDIPPLPKPGPAGQKLAQERSAPATLVPAPAMRRLPQPATTEPAPKQSASRGAIRPVANNPFKRFFSRINPLKRRSSRPGDPRKPDSEKPERIEPLPPQALREQQALQAGPKFIPPAPAAPGLSEPDPFSEADAKGQQEFNPLSQQDDPPTENPTTSDAAVKNDLPGVDVSVKPKVVEIGDSKDAAAADVDNSDPFASELDNPFPDLAEDKADATAAEPDSEDNPFSGLKLDEPVAESKPEPKPAEEKLAVEPPVLPKPAIEVDTAQADEPKNAPPKKAPLKNAPLLPEKAVSETSEKTPLLPPKTPVLPPKTPLLPPKEAPVVKSEAPIVKDTTPESKPKETAPARLPEVKSEQGPKSEVDRKLQKIAERSELTGLKGFCPVVLRDERELKDALPQFHSEHQGRTYHFSSEEALKKFESDPNVYAPAAGGVDVVIAANLDDERGGSLDHAVWYRGRLYLFSSRATRDAFVISPEKYQVKK